MCVHLTSAELFHITQQKRNYQKQEGNCGKMPLRVKAPSLSHTQQLGGSILHGVWFCWHTDVHVRLVYSHSKNG